MKVRRKPLVYDAWQLTHESAEELKRMCGGTTWSRPPMRMVTGITIPTLEGEHHASFGDWIIRGLKGEFWAIKPDIYEESYEPAD